MIGCDPWLCRVCRQRHANACPTLWGGAFVPAPPTLSFADLRMVYALAVEAGGDLRDAWRDLIELRRQDLNRHA